MADPTASPGLAVLDIPPAARAAWAELRSALKSHTPPCAELGPAEYDRLTPTAARRLCTDCPITEPCAGYAVTAGELGVWGATTDQDRRAQRRGHH